MTLVKNFLLIHYTFFYLSITLYRNGNSITSNHEQDRHPILMCVLQVGSGQVVIMLTWGTQPCKGEFTLKYAGNFSAITGWQRITHMLPRISSQPWFQRPNQKEHWGAAWGKHSHIQAATINKFRLCHERAGVVEDTPKKTYRYNITGSAYKK